ncbi:hypothetical protein NDU88_005829 [Pleurodeles waltl]|uniref:Uncharacterized protein n=1 Tax=Pleurodeles waltl TaxID=8319 RepID=A0AAV7UJ89_PLEWA|nr:hypothetical protein NDU88_005829 [Pleurodeles waltl]
MATTLLRSSPPTPLHGYRDETVNGWLVCIPTGPVLDTTMDCILQGITAIGNRLEGMNSSISTFTAKTKSICMDIVGFQNHMTDLEHRVTVVEDQLNNLPERDQELLILRRKLIDLEGWSQRDNSLFFGLPEHVEGSDTAGSLKTTLPKLIGLTFDPPLQFQRTHLIGPMRQDSSSCPHPIIICFLHHEQVRQVLTAAHSQGPYSYKGHKVLIAADFSGETNERRKAFLSL